MTSSSTDDPTMADAAIIDSAYYNHTLLNDRRTRQHEVASTLSTDTSRLGPLVRPPDMATWKWTEKLKRVQKRAMIEHSSYPRYPTPPHRVEPATIHAVQQHILAAESEAATAKPVYTNRRDNYPTLRVKPYLRGLYADIEEETDEESKKSKRMSTTLSAAALASPAVAAASSTIASASDASYLSFHRFWCDTYQLIQKDTARVREIVEQENQGEIQRVYQEALSRKRKERDEESKQQQRHDEQEMHEDGADDDESESRSIRSEFAHLQRSHTSSPAAAAPSSSSRLSPFRLSLKPSASLPTKRNPDKPAIYFTSATTMRIPRSLFSMKSNENDNRNDAPAVVASSSTISSGSIKLKLKLKAEPKIEEEVEESEEVDDSMMDEEDDTVQHSHSHSPQPFMNYPQSTSSSSSPQPRVKHESKESMIDDDDNSVMSDSPHPHSASVPPHVAPSSSLKPSPTRAISAASSSVRRSFTQPPRASSRASSRVRIPVQANSGASRAICESCNMSIASAATKCHRCGYDPIDVEDNPDVRRAAWMGSHIDDGDDTTHAATTTSKKRSTSTKKKHAMEESNISPW